MKMRIITIILALAAVAAWAQEKQSKIGYVAMSNIDNYITIDTATVRVWYALNALDIKSGQVTGHCPEITRNASITQRMMTIFAKTPSRNFIVRLYPMTHRYIA